MSLCSSVEFYIARGTTARCRKLPALSLAAVGRGLSFLD
jgi:hypothetical protein